MRILILAIVALVAIVGSAFFLGTPSTTVPPETLSANIISAPNKNIWIEITRGNVFEFDKNGKLIRELKTGDVLEEKRTVDASNSASANIHFPDGSILKIGSEKIEVPKTAQTTSQITPEISTANPKELKIKIANGILLEKVTEGEKVKFEAILILSDDSEKIVTSEAVWQVLGGIGSIQKDGTFLPKLDPSVSEFGNAFGSIIAIWKDTRNNKEFLGKTSIFKVGSQLGNITQ